MHGLPRMIVGKNKRKTYPLELCTLDPYWEELINAGAPYDKSENDNRIKTSNRKKK